MNVNVFENTMANMTWTEIAKLAKADALVILPVGIIEEHGVHLPLGTDVYLAIAQARNIASGMREKNAPCVIAPPYYWGVISTVTKNFPGSFTAKPEHIKAILTDILESIERSGFKRLIVTNAHGDGEHIRTIITALKKYNQTHSMNVRWLAFENDVKMYGLDGHEDFILSIPSYKLTNRMLGVENLKDTFDVHAGALETAYMQEEFPQLTNLALARLQSPTMLKDEQIKQWMSGKPEYNGLTPAGHVGDPHMSNQLQSKMGEEYIEISRFIIEFYKS